MKSFLAGLSGKGVFTVLTASGRGTWVAQWVRLWISAQVSVAGWWDQALHWAPRQVGLELVLMDVTMCGIIKGNGRHSIFDSLKDREMCEYFVCIFQQRARSKIWPVPVCRHDLTGIGHTKATSNSGKTMKARARFANRTWFLLPESNWSWGECV